MSRICTQDGDGHVPADVRQEEAYLTSQLAESTLCSFSLHLLRILLILSVNQYMTNDLSLDIPSAYHASSELSCIECQAEHGPVQD